jgi:hypothetical protein
MTIDFTILHYLLGVHLTAYFTNIKDGNIKDYRALWLKDTNENTPQ